MLSLDIHAWLEENRDYIQGGFIKKIYQIGEKEFLLKIYKGETRPLYINLAGFLFFEQKDTPETPSMFAMYLRKRFGNAKIISVSQLNFDRIIKFDTGEYSLIVELFGGGNIIVVKEGLIERAYHEREWRHRSILRGYPYEPPPAKLNPLTDAEKLCEILNSSEKDVVRTIATHFNLGRYAEEVCARAGVEKSAKKVSEEECERLKNAMLSLFNFDGCYLYSDFFSPVPLKGRDGEKCPSMNECLRKYFSGSRPRSPEDLKLQNIKEMQMQKIREFEEEAERFRKIGDTIYAHFQEIEALIKEARAGRRDFDRKSKKMSVEFDGLKFDIYVNRSTGENAGIYYDRAKKAREKIKGAKKAIEEIDEKIRAEERRKKKMKERRKKRFWFEKYRWFFTSDGFLVIAGRDARTNEEVVKKHLGDKDLYMHADIHGAPSVVIKSEGREISDTALKEAAQFAVSMSKAWNAGFASMSAYWVYPSQVSKMGESGEYVARGAWVIHGKRNYIHNAPLRLAIGKIEYQGVELPMCGPEPAVQARTSHYAVIEPGDESKESVAKKIAKSIGASVDELVSIMPPGKSKIVRET
ncbi:MAG: fibronectin-binding domain-containing protein [Euryarchaeota archaeon]|nr:fibronectin-binding domain-containing protein [Euryarchaeota archaeon]